MHYGIVLSNFLLLYCTLFHLMLLNSTNDLFGQEEPFTPSSLHLYLAEFMSSDPPTLRQKPCAQLKPYAQKQRLSPLLHRQKHTNLTLGDWLTIVAYYNEQHPMITQTGC